MKWNLPVTIFVIILSLSLISSQVRAMSFGDITNWIISLFAVVSKPFAFLFTSNNTVYVCTHVNPWNQQIANSGAGFYLNGTFYSDGQKIEFTPQYSNETSRTPVSPVSFPLSAVPINGAIFENWTFSGNVYTESFADPNTTVFFQPGYSNTTSECFGDLTVNYLLLPVIVSVQPIPASPKIGDTLDFNVTVENNGNVPIYYSVGSGSGGNALKVSYSPSGFFGSSSGLCSPLLRALTIQPNGTANIGLACPDIYKPLNNSGTLTANLTFYWGYEMSLNSIFSNSISTLYTITVSPVSNITTTTSTTTSQTTPPPNNQVSIISVQSIPTNPKIGDTLDFNVTVENNGNVPIYYGGGAASSLSVIYSNTSIFGDYAGACSSYGFIGTINPNQISNVYLSCMNSNRLINGTGNTVANLTFAYGYNANATQFNNSISFLQTVNVS